MALPGIDPKAKMSSADVDARAKEIGEQQQSIHPTAQLIGSAKGPTAIKLNPAKVRWSKWGNRSESRFKGEKFAAFVEDIRSTGGNKQAALVRPIPTTSEGYEYEIAYGHRRHRGCLVSGQPYLAVVKDMTDIELQQEMEVENRNREDTSTWERAQQYEKQLETYDSIEHMAAVMAVTTQTMYTYLRIAKLPKELVELIDDDLTITQRNALGMLSMVESTDPEVQENFKAKVKAAQETGKKFTADNLWKQIKVSARKEVATEVKPTELTSEVGSSYGSYAVNRARQFKLTIDEITEDELKAIRTFLSKSIKR